MLRRSTTLDEAAKELFLRHLDPEQIWVDVCRVKPYNVPPTIACCEMAFARVAILKFLCRQIHGDISGFRLCSVLDALALEDFQSGDAETEEFYGMSLEVAAESAIGAYLPEAHHPAHIGTLLVTRTECHSSPEILEIFGAFGHDAVQSLRQVHFGRSSTSSARRLLTQLIPARRSVAAQVASL